MVLRPSKQAEVTNRPYQEVGQNPEKEPDIGDPTAQPGTSLSQQVSPNIDDPTAQPGTSSSLQKSTSNAIEASLKNTTTIPSTTPALFKSPEEVRPYLKALPRKKKGGRKPGRTRILTDTPEKGAIEAKYNMRGEKKNG
ncbi:hypothetical protein JTB14_004802 [Gonioctena quinquepunctata]|nr:hypothetical protein JTB14_004802 [Gonioctena quinquepunctata]